MEQQIIGIQGIAGSFHHQVAVEYFGDAVAIIPFDSFQGLIKGLLSGGITKAVMAIENSIAGAILPNYALIEHNDLMITGEHYSIFIINFWPYRVKNYPI